MRTKLVFLLIIYLITFCCIGFGQTQTANVQTKASVQKAPAQAAPQNSIVLHNKIMLAITELIKNGKYSEAEKEAKLLINGHEKFVDSTQQVYRNFATLMEKRLYELQLAEEGNKVKVITVEQPISDGFYFLAIIKFQQKKFEEALSNIQKAIEWNPVRTAYHIERGFILIHQNPPDLALALVSYIRALELADNYEDFAAAMRGIGFIFIEKGDLEGALACYHRAKLYDPNDKVAPAQIDFIRRQAPRLLPDLDGVKAIPLLQARRIPTGINPVHIKILLALADEPAIKNQPREVKALLKRAQQLDPKNDMIKKRLQTLQ